MTGNPIDDQPPKRHASWQIRRNHGEIQRSRLLRGRDAAPASVTSGFAEIDQLTGCNGIPRSHITLITGKSAVGKLTVGARTLAHAQSGRDGEREPVGVLDFTRELDRHFIADCGVDWPNVAFVSGQQSERSIELLHSLICGYSLRAILVNGLGQLLQSRCIYSTFLAALPRLHDAIQQTQCALMFVDPSCLPPSPNQPLERDRFEWIASVHLDLYREYQILPTAAPSKAELLAEVRLVRSRWASFGTTRCMLNTNAAHSVASSMSLQRLEK